MIFVSRVLQGHHLCADQSLENSNEYFQGIKSIQNHNIVADISEAIVTLYKLCTKHLLKLFCSDLWQAHWISIAH
jgi:hypothetical protein